MLLVLVIFVVCVFQSLLRLALFPDVLSSRYNGVSPLVVAHEIEFVIRLSPVAQSIRNVIRNVKSLTFTDTRKDLPHKFSGYISRLQRQQDM